MRSQVASLLPNGLMHGMPHIAEAMYRSIGLSRADVESGGVRSVIAYAPGQLSADVDYESIF
jgi:hypothetical protein